MTLEDGEKLTRGLHGDGHDKGGVGSGFTFAEPYSLNPLFGSEGCLVGQSLHSPNFPQESPLSTFAFAWLWLDYPSVVW